MKQKLYKISKKINVLVVGDLILDEYLYGSVSRISPEAPVPILKLEKKNYSLGGAGNVCSNISTLGASPSIIGVIGQDENSKRTHSLLNKKKIKKKLLINSSKFTTITKSRIISLGQQIIRLDDEKNFKITKIDKDKILRKIKLNIKYYDSIIISDYGKGTCDKELIYEIINLSNTYNVPLFIDPRKENKNFDKYKNSFCITPNMNELNSVYKNVDNKDKEILDCVLDLKKKYNIKNIVVTRGEKGISILNHNNKFFSYKSNAKEVFDVSGAGDTVIAAIATLYSTKIKIETAAMISNLAASISVSFRGTHSVTKKELIEIL